MKLKPNQAAHIDHGFYFLTKKQAKKLAEENQLPRPGYERRANAVALSNLTLGKIERYPLPSDPDNCRFKPLRAKAKSGWITRTPLSWFNGAEIKERAAWALHVAEYLD